MPASYVKTLIEIIESMSEEERAALLWMVEILKRYPESLPGPDEVEETPALILREFFNKLCDDLG